VVGGVGDQGGGREMSSTFSPEVQFLAFLRVCVGDHSADHTEAQAKRFTKLPGAVELRRLVVRMSKAGGAPGGAAKATAAATAEQAAAPAAPVPPPSLAAPSAPERARPGFPALSRASLPASSGGGGNSPARRSARDSPEPRSPTRARSPGGGSGAGGGRGSPSRAGGAAAIAARLAREDAYSSVFGSMEVRAGALAADAPAALARARLQRCAEVARQCAVGRAAAPAAHRAAVLEERAVAELATEMAAGSVLRVSLGSMVSSSSSSSSSSSKSKRTLVRVASNADYVVLGGAE